VVMISWLISTLNSFLGGEITTKFILKSVTALFISGFIFSFYLYDIRRDKAVGKKDKVITSYFYVSLALILVVLVAAFMFVDSPVKTRNKKIDQSIVDDFSRLSGAINSYYNYYDHLPENLEQVTMEYDYIDEDYLNNPQTDQAYQYNVLGSKEYELCTDFITSNKDKGALDDFYNQQWLHEAGYQCLKQKITKEPAGMEDVRPL